MDADERKDQRMRVALIKAGVVAAVLAVGLQGCGLRGSLENPADAKENKEKTATADSGQGKPEGAALRPHKPFILDGLIR